MALYPIFIDLTWGKTLVAGAGAVGLRKIEGLREAGGGEILVLDPERSGKDLPADDRICFARRAVTAADVLGRVLVFAATSNRAENARIAALCAAAAVPCNVADDPAASSFHVPARTACGDIQIAVGTGGRSPALAKRIRMEIEERIVDRYVLLTALLGRLRPLVLAEGRETADNTALFRSLVESKLADTLAARDQAAARSFLQDLLPPSLHGRIEELLHGLW